MRPKSLQPSCMRGCSRVLKRHIRCQHHPVFVTQVAAVVDTLNRAAGCRLDLAERHFNVKESVALFIFVSVIIAPMSDFCRSLSAICIPNAVINSKPWGVFDTKTFEVKTRDEMVMPRLVRLRSSVSRRTPGYARRLPTAPCRPGHHNGLYYGFREHLGPRFIAYAFALRPPFPRQRICDSLDTEPVVTGRPGSGETRHFTRPSCPHCPQCANNSFAGCLKSRFIASEA